MPEQDIDEIWNDDLLGYRERGDAFTSLVTSIEDHRTISIEAGYGRGKTFFRERWAKQLKASGECVVEIDARLSDHSGGPVITFLGALLNHVPKNDAEKWRSAVDVGKKIAVGGAKIISKAVLREGAEELFDQMSPADGDAGVFEEIAKAAGEDLSKAAGDAIARQLSAEKTRLELNEHLKVLHAQITAERDTDRIIVLIDELDRCHPDYAIALLEAMKLVFDQDGFVFMLMVNREYLENIAARRFGGAVEGEFYIEKFVDLRLKLEADAASMAAATHVLTLQLELEKPLSEHPAFGVEAAAKLAHELGPRSGLSMRQIKKTIERVDLCCRIYRSEYIDLPLLIWLAFTEGTEANDIQSKFGKSTFPRSEMTPENGHQVMERQNSNKTREGHGKYTAKIDHEINAKYPEFLTLERHQMHIPDDGKDYFPWYCIYYFLAPHYIPDHEAMLDAVHRLQVD
ncbi:P-loop NTPase fold protein [uncultured Sulfitobacter sp.]|uniref:KAP family P-loop NTPase fold protein n=1 Tax=uncultured Sulfitobacter sp. TaxID=191468 RepID=UPI002609D224|nr:P-loop NTPase fold protein [uncultured Sulfitobacter sp.]